MEPDRCSFCKGRLIKGETEFIVRVGSRLLVIRDIPAYVCEECGEAYYTPDISRRIDRIMERFHESKLLVHPIAAGELCMQEDVGGVLA
jgi:YgiT-type zinc finger domain-containing protein